MPTQWTVIPPIRRHLTCRTDTPSESGRVVRCSWTSSPTRRLKVNATMIPSIMEDIPFMTLFDRPRRTDVTIRAMSAATRMFVRSTVRPPNRAGRTGADSAPPLQLLGHPPSTLGCIQRILQVWRCPLGEGRSRVRAARQRSRALSHAGSEFPATRLASGYAPHLFFSR